ncbi:hypothetical protein CNYM01_13425 [Colletotrichum nymphaeae SA-01]|uniref:Uncharacterized protein n=1 Tax=Colletotrichum nymphaeae SA-01 TaxID=1460502 RepID=A0A135UY04_9PEZI|nr:hypothetical protein CNYM01_13425 [Colletotrichum nymphaeae SA-01]
MDSQPSDPYAAYHGYPAQRGIQETFTGFPPPLQPPGSRPHERPPQCLGTCPPPYDDRDHLQHQNTWAYHQLQPESPEMHSRFQGLGAYDQYRPQPSAHEPRLRYPRLVGALDNAERTSLDGTETSSLDASESESDASEASNSDASDSEASNLEASDSEASESESGE